MIMQVILKVPNIELKPKQSADSTLHQAFEALMLSVFGKAQRKWGNLSSREVLERIQRCKTRGHWDSTYCFVVFKVLISLSLPALRYDPDSCKKN